MLFTYYAKKITGEEITGEMEAKDRFEVARSLRQKGFSIVTCEPKRESKKFKLFSFFSLPISVSDKMIFSRNFGVMNSAGLSVSRALEILGKQTEKENFRKVILGLKDSVTKGKPLSEAMKEYPKVFSPFFVAMVRVGEESGRLSDSMKLIADQLERDNNLIKKVRGAMVYPIIIITVMILIGILMLIYVVPTLVSTFKELGVDLPTSTKIVIFLSDFFTGHFILFVLILLSLIMIFVLMSYSQRGKRFFSTIVLKIPIISGITKKINSARTSRTLASLISGGVNIIEALSITEDVLQNHHYKNVLERAKEEVQKGSPMSEIFKEADKFYPLLVGEMMAVGEETGKMSDMLMRLASFYEEEVENATKDLTTIIEPFLMVIIGLVVGFFAVSMIQPMYSMTGGF